MNCRRHSDGSSLGAWEGKAFRTISYWYFLQVAVVILVVSFIRTLLVFLVFLLIFFYRLGNEGKSIIIFAIVGVFKRFFARFGRSFLIIIVIIAITSI